MDVDFPFRLDGRGRTATSDRAGHLRDLVEQLLFTAPGERVNRPSFGTGLLQLVFLPNGEPLAAATQAAVQGALSQWLGDLIEVRDVTVEADEAVLRVTVSYLERRTQQPQVVTFTGSAP
jgi:phage baseplate assembly protein W